MNLIVLSLVGGEALFQVRRVNIPMLACEL